MSEMIDDASPEIRYAATYVFGEARTEYRMWRRGLVIETEFSTLTIGPGMVEEADRMIERYNGGMK